MQRSDTVVDYIYEPIQGELAKVEENLRRIANTSQVHLDEFLKHVLPSQGKLIRPAITILVSRFHPNTGELPVIMATSLELLHIASLIHDDTVDNSSLRRGLATVSSLWGRDVAVLLGDYIFATAAAWACDTDNMRVLRRFAETIKELSSGELMESYAAFNADYSYEQYKERIYNKTASLFRTAAEGGAVLSGIAEENIQALTEYGYNLGMAFQIVDDILDFEGTEEEVGKPVGADLLQGTLTLPAILLLEQYPRDNPILALFQGNDPEINSRRAVEMVQRSSIIAESNAIAADFSDRAVRALHNFPDTRERRSLEELSSYVISRRH